ncbi:MAG: hypothetical protein E4H08_06390, partial [Candidatus Atribacteria bacterium]
VDTSEPKSLEDDGVLSLDAGVPSILVLNKCDLTDAWDAIPSGPWSRALRVSAKQGQGVESLRQEILRLLVDGDLPTRNSVLLLDTWERDLLRRTRDKLVQACKTAHEQGQPDMVAEELRVAYQTASELQGIDISESILDAVFSRFCVGK